jgi:hypothetical protein
MKSFNRNEVLMAKTNGEVGAGGGGTPVENPTIQIQKITQTQKVTDLATGVDDFPIELKYEKYTLPSYDPKFGTENQFLAGLFTAVQNLVADKTTQLEALLYRATQDSYQNGKAAALSTGEYLTSELKAKIVQVMKSNQAFMELTAKECVDKWKAGFIAKKPGALKILDTAKALGDFSAEDL